MITLPEIDRVELLPDGVRLHFVVATDLEYFDGHFPEVPLLPGVVQIGWAVELARLHLGAAAKGTLDRFNALTSIKFMRVIQPGAAVWLSLAVDQESRELAFEYRADEHTCSSGRVRFH